MYTTFSERFAQPTSDLAARLTDLGLEILAGAGTGSDSVQTELRLWHTLRCELRELGLGCSLPGQSEGVPLDGVLRQVVRRAVRRVAGETHPVPEYQTWCGEPCLCQA